jgi:hypothetical protein
VTNFQCFNPALLAKRERYKKPQFDKFGNGKVPVKLLPQGIIGYA